MQKAWVRSLDWEPLLEKEWQPAPVFLPGKSHGQRSLAGYSPLDRKDSDMTERLTHTPYSWVLHTLSHIVNQQILKILPRKSLPNPISPSSSLPCSSSRLHCLFPWLLQKKKKHLFWVFPHWRSLSTLLLKLSLKHTHTIPLLCLKTSSGFLLPAE